MQCPTNQQVGKPIDTLTLKALLAVPLTQVHAIPYGFCPDPTCPTVYFSETDACFTEADLRENVYQKHVTDADVFICYCGWLHPHRTRANGTNECDCGHYRRYSGLAVRL